MSARPNFSVALVWRLATTTTCVTVALEQLPELIAGVPLVEATNAESASHGDHRMETTPTLRARANGVEMQYWFPSLLVLDWDI